MVRLERSFPNLTAFTKQKYRRQPKAGRNTTSTPLMKDHQFRNRVVEGSLTLPVMSCVTFLSWLLSHSIDNVAAWLTMAMVALLTYAIVECNNQCQLLRIRSRMVSATFLAFVSAIPAFHAITWHWIPAASLLLAYFVAFKAYGQLHPQGWVFHAFMYVGIGSVVFPPLLLVVPFMLFSFSHQLRILTGKAFTAALLGLALPYWMYGTFCFITGWDLKRLLAAWTRAVQPGLPDYSCIEGWQVAVFAFILFLALVSMFHFVHTSYNDKIRTRQYYYCIFSVQLPLLFIAVWFPDCALFTLPLFLTNSVPFIAHYFALARGRFMNRWFICCILLLLVVAAFNYLDLWQWIVLQVSGNVPLSFL